MVKAFGTGKAAADSLIHIFDRNADFSASDELSQTEFNTWFSAASLNYCVHAQEGLKVMDACNAGCADLEVAYGTTSSLAKNRFRRVLSSETQGLKRLGLWNRNYTDVPEGDELTQACNELFGFDGGQSVARAGVAAALSKLTQAQGARSGTGRHRIAEPQRPTLLPLPVRPRTLGFGRSGVDRRHDPVHVLAVPSNPASITVVARSVLWMRQKLSCRR